MRVSYSITNLYFFQLRPALLETVDALEIFRVTRLERQLGDRIAAPAAYPLPLIHLALTSLRRTSALLRTLLCMAVAAGEPFGTPRLERQFRDGRPTPATCPVSLMHSSSVELVVLSVSLSVHCTSGRMTSSRNHVHFRSPVGTSHVKCRMAVFGILLVPTMPCMNFSRESGLS